MRQKGEWVCERVWTRVARGRARRRWTGWVFDLHAQPVSVEIKQTKAGALLFTKRRRSDTRLFWELPALLVSTVRLKRAALAEVLLHLTAWCWVDCVLLLLMFWLDAMHVQYCWLTNGYTLHYYLWAYILVYIVLVWLPWASVITRGEGGRVAGEGGRVVGGRSVFFFLSSSFGYSFVLNRQLGVVLQKRWSIVQIRYQNTLKVHLLER